jgi:hypothetical protein
MARKRRERDTLAYIAMLRRLVAAGGRRVAQSDEYELAEFLELQTELELAIGVAIGGQLLMGKSWSDIATATGTSRQSSHQRYSKLVDRAREAAEQR